MLVTLKLFLSIFGSITFIYKDEIGFLNHNGAMIVIFGLKLIKLLIFLLSSPCKYYNPMSNATFT